MLPEKKVKQIIVELPAEKEFARLLRLLVAGIGWRLNFNLDAVEDLKIAVEEGFLLFLKEKSEKAKVLFQLQPDGLEIIFYEIKSFREKDSLGHFILQAVVDEIQVINIEKKPALKLVKHFKG